MFLQTDPDMARIIARSVGLTLRDQIGPEYRPHQLLDLGCGIGSITAELKKFFPNTKVYGLDHQPQNIQLAAHSSPDCMFMVGDINSLPFQDKSVDVVFTGNIYDYMYIPSDPTNTTTIFQGLYLPRVLSEIHRVLTPGGLYYPFADPIILKLSETKAAGFTPEGRYILRK